MDLRGKVALVTGGARRVGGEISKGLAKAGIKIGLHFNSSESDAKELSKSIRAEGGEVKLLQGDFTKFNEIEKTVQRCVEHFGRIDFFINNAALYYKTPLLTTTEKEWDALFDVNLKFAYFCAKSVAEIMLSQKSGKIINIADVSAYSPWPDYIPYCITKAGIIALTKGLAKRLAPDIQVNAIASGTVLMGDDTSAADRSKIEAETLLKQVGTPDDIVNTILFLLGGSDYITGAVIPVDGGKLIA